MPHNNAAEEVYLESYHLLLDGTGSQFTSRGLYIGKYPPPPRGEKYQPMSYGGKNMKRQREKGEKCKRKKRKGERK
jgi:hypothetical protein